MILDRQHEMQRKLFRQFAEKEFTRELQDRLDETHEFDWEIFHRIAAGGFLGTKIPVEYGGQGGDNLTYALMAEEFARQDLVLAIYSNTSNSLGGGPLMIAATEEQKKKYLPEVAAGKKILCFGLTEPGAGSDAGGTATTAIEDGDHYILNGRKAFTSAAPIADWMIAFARTDLSAKGSRGISMFIVDLKSEGVTIGAPEKKMGIRGYPTSDVVFEDVRVPKENLIGPLHRGFQFAMKTLDGGRLGTAANGVGVGQACLDEAVRYAKERKQFGRPIADFQAISFMIADMQTELEAARQLTWHAAVLKDRNDPGAGAACAMAKYYACEMANRNAYKAVQIHGGYGYVEGFRVERLYRDARILSIFEGTSQIQQLVISNSLLR
ncbi:MAG: acyl-CoA dehydrogenase family protein [Mogibacterium sp.]|nr:acyl-CoA dehydrogenase family protein [Mogibacterium sp.]